ncbi:MAG: hypothetical protein P8J01_00425 [Acidimicrobiales bacterium]|nr:hypothetical protein [Acidimicrobiales bacterium]
MTNHDAQLLQLTICGEAAAWKSVGFNVIDIGNGNSICSVGGVKIYFENDTLNKGIWRIGTKRISGVIDSLKFDDLSVERSFSDNHSVLSDHPNGITGIDHLVVTTPNCNRTTKAFEETGMAVRKVRTFGKIGSETRQTFFWLGNVILELVGSNTKEDEGPPSIWGIAFVSKNIEETVNFLGDTCTPLKPAIQPGRRITTIKTQEFDIYNALAVMSPHGEAI